MENGPRVSAFKVDSRGRLLSLPSAIDGTLVGSSTAKFTSSLHVTLQHSYLRAAEYLLLMLHFIYLPWMLVFPLSMMKICSNSSI
uniref:Uncharacterized protein n=1 Tax=Ditylenchus dipsaci TaxID=166011 RepID=A0A915ELV8_9BILA